jgi:glutamate N-acetyltransferase/amino-acid N-acetyltransferase
METKMIQVPLGFSFAAYQAGFKYADRDDLALVLSAKEASAAGVFTQNAFQAAPIKVAQSQIEGHPFARAMLVNAGQANACTGEQGVSDCRQTQALIAQELGLSPEDVLPASTGVIGERMPMALWPVAAKAISDNLSRDGVLRLARAIMTTDKFPKLSWRSLVISGQEVRLLGIAKGAGMICPNMATMLGFVCTDVAIPPEQWQDLLAKAVGQSFNRISVDGETSTNDCVLGLANGRSGAKWQDGGKEFEAALTSLCRDLARLIVQDAEGGTKLVRIKVIGASSSNDAERAARAIAHSPLVKTALFGQDPNWGRIVAALGHCGAQVKPESTRVKLAGLVLFEAGLPVQGDLDGLLAPHIGRDEVSIEVDLGLGQGQSELLTSDLSLDYVRINSNYRT